MSSLLEPRRDIESYRFTIIHKQINRIKYNWIFMGKTVLHTFKFDI